MKADNELVLIKIIIAYSHNVSDTLAEPHTFNLALLKETAIGVSMRSSPVLACSGHCSVLPK